MKNQSKNGVNMGRHLGIVFFVDFGGLLEASWEGRWSQDRSKKASKKRRKNARHQDGHKIEKRRSDDPRGEGSRALGRPPPFKAGRSPVLQEASRFGPPVLSWPLKSSQVLYSP